VVRNLILQAARQNFRRPGETPHYEPRQNVSIAMLPFENDQGITTWDFVGMLAYEYMFWNSLAKEYYNGRPAHEFCNGEDIQVFVEEKKLPASKVLRAAIEYGMEELAKLNIFIYDSKDENGGLRRYADLQRIVNMHHSSCVQPGQHEIYIVDYAQLVLNSGKIFEDTRLFSGYMLHDVATGMNATAIALTQFNRETNKASAKGDDNGDVMGTRGGADMEQDCHMYYEAKYNPEVSPEEIELALRRARRAAGTRTNFAKYKIHPASGYMMTSALEKAN
jgi:hypothetical protein